MGRSAGTAGFKGDTKLDERPGLDLKEVWHTPMVQPGLECSRQGRPSQDLATTAQPGHN